VSARVKVYAVVGTLAAAAAASVVVLTAVTADHLPKPRTGKPPFVADWTAPRPLAASVQAAIAAWPRGTLSLLQDLVVANPRSAFVHLHLGLARYWSRDDAEAVAQWRVAKRVDPDTPSAVRAGDLLHPDTPRGLPQFFPTFELGGQTLSGLAAAARRPDVRAKLAYGVALQRLERPVSAERQFAAAAVLAPNDPEAQVAAAVGRFDKDRPALAFSRLGPLATRFPGSQTVRFHLGLLSIWIRDFGDARRQLRLAVEAGPKTRFATEARTLLNSLGNGGTS
jgi:tetratricopeptide (TPR) repeat protein